MNKFKSYIIILIILFLSNKINAQNIIYNGSFEIRQSIYSYAWDININCPHASGLNDPNIYTSDLLIAKGWYDPYNIGDELKVSFDYYHSCCNRIYPDSISFSPCYVGVPRNYWLSGYQYPRTGDGYIGGGLYNIINTLPINGGEYVQSKLLSPLEKDSLYKLSFYVNRANRCKYSIWAIGAYFSSDKIVLDDLIWDVADSIIMPQVINSNTYIKDSLNWIKIEGVFKAEGEEQYITLGNYDLSKNQADTVDNTAVYNTAAYNFDDISLYKVNTKAKTANCGNDTLICSGDSIQLGNSYIKQEYQEDYIFEWYELGMQDSIISYKQNPWVKPISNTTYILKLTDFKYDKTYDTITVYTKECKLPEIVKIYPNPTFDIVNFEFNDPIRVNTSIDLYDITGKLILSYTLNKDYDSRYIKLNLQNLSSGMYIYSVKLNVKKEFKGKLVLLK